MERVLLFKWIGLFVFLMFLVFLVYKIRKRSRVKYLETYIFHSKIKDKIKTVYPHLSSQELDIVLKALREYFCVCQVAGKKMVSMPSQVVDVAWHEFILYTRSYQKFCKKLLGISYITHRQRQCQPLTLLRRVSRGHGVSPASGRGLTQRALDICRYYLPLIGN